MRQLELVLDPERSMLLGRGGNWQNDADSQRDGKSGSIEYHSSGYATNAAEISGGSRHASAKLAPGSSAPRHSTGGSKYPSES
jgi:hypothetical protein